MSSRERLTLAVALAVALGAAAVVPLYSDLHWVLKGAGGIAAVAAGGLVARRANVPGILQPVITTAALLLYVCLVFARTTLGFGLLPTGDTITAINDLFQTGLTDIDRLAPPVPTDPGLTLIAVLGVGAVAIVVDLIAVVFGRAAIAGLPLLVLYAVPSAVLPGGLGWIPFVFVAAGWLWLMLVEGSDRVSRWGTPLKTDRPDRSARYDDTSLGRVGRRIGAAALGVAVIVPAMIPGLDARLIGGVGGDGNGKGSRTTTTYNPITKLRDDLRLPKPHDILTYTTNAKAPDYLRMTTLDEFSDAGWSSSKLSGNPKENGLKGTLPYPRGLSSTAVDEVRVKVKLRNLDAQWLPVPAVPSKVDVDGPWMYDDRTETVFSIHSSTRKVKKQYSVTAIKVNPDRTVLAQGAETGADEEIRQYARDPKDEVTPFVRELTEKVIKGKTSAYAKVAAIQAYFSPANGFRYSETTQVPGIDSPSALQAFLQGKRGFCEQYASAMAAMIRIAGVPARVAVGFTMGVRQPDGSYRVTTDDAHAWPEAWFSGVGWLRFEPTPRRDGQTTVPLYAVPADTGGNTPGAAEQPDLPDKSAAGDTGEESDIEKKLNRLDPDVGTDPGAAGARVQSSHRSLAVLVLLVVAFLIVLPRLLHLLRRRRRWRTGGAIAGWEQVRDDATDIGHLWRPADSPRAAATALAQRHALDVDARKALWRLALAAERTRYARDGAVDASGLYDDAAAVRTALHAGVSRSVRWRAWLAPPSTLHWTASTLGTFVADVLDGFDNAWSSVRRLGRARTRPT